ncbi:MAG: 2'-5' RNA ligase family protein [Hyphomonadaceae bacterium]|nr:2'-5' RNA ligase family protein [Hyphomonadaceae bacterium]
MTGQQSLFADMAPPPERRDRLFFAVLPDAHTADRIFRFAQTLRTELGMTTRVQDAGRMHVTLHHLGDFAGVPQHVVEAACGAASTVRAAPFDVVFDSAGSFSGKPGKLPLVLRGDDNPGLRALQRALGAAMAKALLPPDASFTPHVTLLRDPVSAPAASIDPIGWRVREFVLIHSLIGQTLHVPLGSWTLQD